MPICSRCGKEYSVSRQDSTKRTMVSLLSGMFPGLKEVTEEARAYCNDCYKERVLPVAKGFLKEEDIIKEPEKQ